MFKLYLFLFILCFCNSATVLLAGPFSDFKAGAELSEELTSSPTVNRNMPTSDSLDQAIKNLDPQNSVMWDELRENLLGINSRVKFVEDVKVIMQDHVEEPHEVPLIVKIPKRLHAFTKFILIIENNPIQQVIELNPYKKIEALGMNVRLEDDSPVRAAVLDQEGVWHVGSKMVFVASPGGCSSPSCDPTVEICEQGEVGKIAVKQYGREGKAERIKLKITHPMETGFVVGVDGEVIPEYYVNKIHVDDNNGPIADIATYAALSSDPVILLDLPEKGQSIRVHVKDSQGLEFFSHNTM
ncbi:MAG: quinoprotein dehydrogenase-associated SoxYZ-like carrier [Pelagibacterales bacterium]|nr:quinoprotein dehydrogenase-associated SoxYZ-like carrier [Pelagibacterales bacterium]|tara:strand:- start:5971 stop:6864 length:894 start_codon:yes stop_codon:yes gene_type:complete